MGMKIQYIGPKDHKEYEGRRFPRLTPIDVPDAFAAKLLANPTVFAGVDEEIPAEILADRGKLGDAMIAEGEYHKEQYYPVLYAAKAMKAGAIDEATGKPNWEMQKRLDSIAGAQGQIDYGDGLIAKGKAFNAKVALEGDDLAPTVKRGRQKAEAIA